MIPSWKLKSISRKSSSSLLSNCFHFSLLAVPRRTRIQLFSKLLSWHHSPSLRIDVATIRYALKVQSSLQLSPQIPHFGMVQTRSHSTKEKDVTKTELIRDHKHENGANQQHNDHEPHSHSRSFFGHTHSHEEDSHAHDPEQIIAALKGSGDRGSYITLVGLFSNVALTGVKGIAGWYMHSASLVADAGHSLSDLLGDFVTLFCWRLSRKPPSNRYPYGFAKFETIGTTTISILLIGGALGIGFHSYHLLILALSDTASNLPPSHLQDVLQYITSSAPLPQIGHEHAQLVDPNAAWFAAASIAIKEWLYRITKVVADEEKSPVLLANAYHHRSDAYSSLVAFFAIIGTWIFPKFPLDPVGGLLVSVVILRQGFGLLADAWGDLTDAGVSQRTREALNKALDPLLHKSDLFDGQHPALLSVSRLRARRAGSVLFVDLTAQVPGCITVDQASALEQKIERTLKNARKEIAEVRVSFRPSDHSQNIS